MTAKNGAHIAIPLSSTSVHTNPPHVMRLLGIDLGTGSVKLVTLDADGVERAVASEPYALSSPQPGWAEIAPDTWWLALVRAAARLPADERALVAAIGCSGQM
ncbi:FGGY family carbohydrate kinase, partial [Staphylococcus lugdunensis]|nr:FGGY family carbohydrate kinase [Staphylococcus lugdunensis]